MNEMDLVRLNFNPQSLWALNFIIGLVMFGVALDLKVADFKAVLTTPKPVLIGLAGQFLLLPAFTFLLVLAIKPAPSIALGMMLVAACPGGNISNFLTHYARGNTALSITWTGYRFPNFVGKAHKPVKIFSLAVFGLFVIGALAANWQYFLKYVGFVVFAVFLHNGLALLTGYFAAKVAGLPERDRRAVSIEVGIQNSALGLILIFNFFDGLGGMAIVTAWWGIWHIVSGLTVATLWSRRPPV